MNDPAWLHTQVPTHIKTEELSPAEKVLWDALMTARDAGVGSDRVLTLAKESWYNWHNIQSDRAYEQWQKGQKT